jgi:nicotinamidase-related amidase
MSGTGTDNAIQLPGPAFNRASLDPSDGSWRHLVVDVQREMCDLDLIKAHFESGDFIFSQNMDETLRRTRALEDVAHAIDNFVTKSRGVLPPVWVSYVVPEYADPDYFLSRYYQNQGAPHMVQHAPGDVELQKSHASTVPENESAFAAMKVFGVRGFVISGMYASACVHETVADLVKAGFQVIVAADLVGDHQPETVPDALEKLKDAGATVMNSAEIIGRGSELSLRNIISTCTPVM